MDTPAALFRREGSNRETIVIAERPYKPQKIATRGDLSTRRALFFLL
jgi:hypothetical protein